MSRAASRNRVLGDRLWDETGRVWTRSPDLLTASEVDRLVQAEVRVVLHGFGRPMVHVLPPDTRGTWLRLRPFIDDDETDGEHDGVDEDGLVWAARLWRSGTDVLVAFESFC